MLVVTSIDIEGTTRKIFKKRKKKAAWATDLYFLKGAIASEKNLVIYVTF